MSLLKPVDIQKGDVGADASGEAYKVSAIIANGVAIPGEMALNTTYALLRPSDATGIGLNAAYDTANSVVLANHIQEFYRMAGEGTPLYLMVVPQATLPTAMLTAAKQMVIDAEGSIFQMALAFNPATGYTETSTDGINTDIRAAIAPAQTFAKWCFDKDFPLQVLLEGRAYSGNATSSINLRALEISSGVPLEADKVSIVMGQDYDYAESLGWALGKKYASVGNALGTLAKIKVNQNIGEVETLNLTNVAKSAFLQAGLSNHTLVKANYDSLETLNDKGYIFPYQLSGISGYRWNDSHTCTPVKIDSEGNMNEYNIELGRTLDYTIRRLRTALLPKVKTVQDVDVNTGKLPIGTIKYFEGLGNDVFEQMRTEGLISGGKTIVDKNSDLQTGERALNVSFTEVPTSILANIKGIINIKTTL